MGSIDRPGRPDEPDQPERHGQAREPEAARAERLGLDKLSRADYYKSQQAEATAQDAASLGPDRKMPRGAPDHLGGARPEDKPTAKIESFPRNYWTEIPRFLARWREHLARWPRSRELRADRPMNPEQRAQAVEAIQKVPDAEPSISGNVKRIEAENTYRGWLKGFEFRLKGKDRLMEKVADKVAAEADRSPESVVREIPDAIRYTFCFERENYSAGYWDIKARFESCGYEMYHCKNWWTNPEYKGVNTRWVTPEGQRFEVQFHTRESFHAKHEVTHHAYERARNPMTSRAELAELEKFQRQVSSWIPVPDRVDRVPDYRKKGI